LKRKLSSHLFKMHLPISHMRFFLFKNTTMILGWISLPKIFIHYVATTTKRLENIGEYWVFANLWRRLKIKRKGGRLLKLPPRLSE
jgi:hypothetical protein